MSFATFMHLYLLAAALTFCSMVAEWALCRLLDRLRGVPRGTHRARKRSWEASVLHNCCIHPLLPFLPTATGTALHDWSLRFWPEESPPPKTPRRQPIGFGR